MAFYIGATPDNAGELAELERLPACAGIKMFMGSSTGNLLVADDANVAKVLANGSRRIAVHAEDEQRLQERFTIVRGGASPALHAEWRDAETAARATDPAHGAGRGRCAGGCTCCTSAPPRRWRSSATTATSPPSR